MPVFMFELAFLVPNLVPGLLACELVLLSLGRLLPKDGHHRVLWALRLEQLERLMEESGWALLAWGPLCPLALWLRRRGRGWRLLLFSSRLPDKR